MWGILGTLLAALAMRGWTGEARWEEAARESAEALRARRGEDGLWRQDDDYRDLGTLHGAAGNTLALLRFEPDEALAAETATVLSRHAFREDGLANWPAKPRTELVGPEGQIRLQWCTGAPGVVAGAWDYLDEELLLAGAELVCAGAHGDEKGHGICHGTSGNGFALLKTFARTGDERWLEGPLRRPRARPGRTPPRGERPWPLLALDGRRGHRFVRCGLPRRRRTLSDPRRRLSRPPTRVRASPDAPPSRWSADRLEGDGLRNVWFRPLPIEVRWARVAT